jgi:glutamine amidotransferase
MKVTVLDYGIGNLFSVRHALEYCGASVELASQAESVKKAERLVIPGVGAFKDGIETLRSRGLEVPVQELAASGRPVLGICLGMQMLFSFSEEFGRHHGLGLIDGTVCEIPKTGSNGRAHKIPHIGWGMLEKPENISWSKSIFHGLPEKTATYFVHSFHAVPKNDQDLLAFCLYDGVKISAAVRKGNIFGCQFHPEKSGEAGLSVLREFLRMS